MAIVFSSFFSWRLYDDNDNESDMCVCVCACEMMNDNRLHCEKPFSCIIIWPSNDIDNDNNEWVKHRVCVCVFNFFFIDKNFETSKLWFIFIWNF